MKNEKIDIGEFIYLKKNMFDKNRLLNVIK